MHMIERRARVSVIVHGDLFDSDDCLNALGVMESWASHTGLMFCNGLGIGLADEMIRTHYDENGNELQAYGFFNNDDFKKD